MLKRITYILFFAVIASCGEETDTSEIPKETVAEDTVINLNNATTSLPTPEYFVQIPDTIMGCSGMYAADSASLYNGGKYIFMTNLQGLALLKINGETIYLQHETEMPTPEGGYEVVYNGNGYKVKLITKEKAQVGDEVWDVTGRLEIEKDSRKTQLTIYGQEGC